MSETQEDFAWTVVFVIGTVILSFIYHNEIWAFLDWCMTTTENFHRRQ